MTDSEPQASAPATRLIVSDVELFALLELAHGRLAEEEELVACKSAGLVTEGSPTGVLADGLAALVAPLCELELQRGERGGRGAADGNCATLIVPGPDVDSHQLIVVPTQFLPDALSRLNDLGPRPRVEPAVRLRYAAGDLAQILATRDATVASKLAGAQGADAAARLVDTLREHWRVEVRWAPAPASPGRRAVEVLDSDEGVWLVVPDGADVELWPSTPTVVFRQLSNLLPDMQEMATAG